ncbi:MAG: hypothetical protein F9K30_23475 [Dechloromonas sp.]|nr:MAG: hypothetical protein F9K30_23475 [Dechloromonas sp.]
MEHIPWNDPANQVRKRRLTTSTGWRYLQGTGKVTGNLIGGCVEVLDWLRGTVLSPQAHQFEKAILFLETSEEGLPPHALERTLRVYAAMGLLQKLSGILVGRPGGQVPIETFSDYDNAILRVVAEEEGLTHLPIVTNMDFGHTDPMFVLPYGVRAQIDCDQQRFDILESAVVEAEAVHRNVVQE